MLELLKLLGKESQVVLEVFASNLDIPAEAPAVVTLLDLMCGK